MIKSMISGLKRALFLPLLAAIFSATGIVLPVNAQIRYSESLLPVRDTVVKRILPIPASDSSYIATDYTEIHFRLNKPELDISYMDNGLAMLHLDRVIDSIGAENITAIEIVSQSSPEGTLERNQWLTKNRSEVMLYYMYRVFPSLKEKISMNTVTESWDNLARYVAQDPLITEDTRKRILEVIDSKELSVAAKKTRMKRSLGKDPNVGNVYSYLLEYYYPVIRNSGIYILHNVEPKTAFNIEIEKPHIDETSSIPKGAIELPSEDKKSESTVRKRPLLAAKTNLLYNSFFTKDLGWGPIYNIEAELYPTENGRWTWLLEYEFPWHTVLDKHQYFQILNLQFEGRRYFRKASNHTGHYLSVYLGANLYDICFDKQAGHGYQGEGFGGGLGYGYVIPLGKKPDTRWKLELLVKAGAYMTLYDPYDAGSPFRGKYYYEWYDAPSLFIRRNMIFRWFGPTGIGATISYDLIRKKVTEDDKTK
jgi:hypothetical protein